ncbi:hypothetical protein ACI8AA_01360 [Geodermatophilus sp. SYSU D01180]
MAAATSATLVGCGASDADRTEELREAMRVHYEFDSAYDGLGTVTVRGDEAIVDTEAWADPAYGAYLYCSWVENWVRRDLDDPDMDVVVIMDGQEVLRARGLSETCLDAEPQV